MFPIFDFYIEQWFNLFVCVDLCIFKNRNRIKTKVDIWALINLSLTL